MSTAAAALPIPSRWHFLRLRNVLSFRFSLRELLLVMLVCAVSAAWLRSMLSGTPERNPAYQPTKIADYFTNELPEDVAAAQAALGEDGNDVLLHASKSRPFAMEQIPLVHPVLHGICKTSAARHWSCSVRLPWNKRAKFQDDLIARIHNRLFKNNAGIMSEAHLAGSDHIGACTKYGCGVNQGIIRFYVVRTSEETAQLFATLDEHYNPPPP
jgi:hypothetical protein